MVEAVAATTRLARGPTPRRFPNEKCVRQAVNDRGEANGVLRRLSWAKVSEQQDATGIPRVIAGPWKVGRKVASRVPTA